MPGVFVASEVFVDAAASQAKALGFDPASVFVQHPIQDRTDDAITDILDVAERAVDELLSHLQG